MKQNLIWSSQPIFISSTFSDMNAERDALRDYVFKEIEEKLHQRRVRLEPIDLRWGVETSTEEEKEQKELLVLKVCLNDIKRSRPFFIGIIGDRYGWIPPEERMSAAEKEMDFDSKIKNKSVTALEIEYGVLASTDQLKRSFFFFREPLPYDQMPENLRPVYSDMHNPELKDIDVRKRLNELKKEIIKSVGEERVFTYKAEWDGAANKVKDKSLDDFKKKVAEVLWKELDLHTEELEGERPQTWEEEEERYLNDFIEDRTISFSGREDIIDELKKFALGEAGFDNWGKCMTGESGSGKSALIAMLYKELSEEKDVILLAHAAGISLRSNSLQNMLTIWIKQLAEKLKVDLSEQLSEKPKSESEQLLERSISGDDKSKEKSKFEELKNLFANLLSQAAVNKRIVVLVDALNQFERTVQAKYMSWLPELIPANAKFIFTAIPGEETENLSKRKGITLEALKEVGWEDADKIISVLCKRYHKTLNRKAIEALLEKKKDDGVFSYSNPLWLTMAIDDFLLMDEDDFARMKELEGDAETKLTQLLIQTAEKMPPDIEGMYQYVFNRCKIFGADFVNGLLIYMGISRNGLRESDLEHLINDYNKIKWENLNFAAFRRYLRNHIVQKGELGLWDFRHVKARESLKKSLLKDETTVVKLHKNLSAHLDKLNEEDPLRLTEIIWHLFKCDEKRRAAEVYGSNSERFVRWEDNPATGEYSKTLCDILLEKECNLQWICSLTTEQNLSDPVKRAVNLNLLFSLDEIIKDILTLNLRLDLFKAILLSTKKILKSDPESVNDKRDLSLIFDNIGFLYRALGNTKAALQNYRSSQVLREELCKNRSDIDRFQIDLVIVYNYIGELYQMHQDTSNALNKYEKSLNIIQELQKRYPNSAEIAYGLAITYSRVGMIYEDLFDIKKTLEWYNGSLLILEELQKLKPDSEEYAWAISCAYDGKGDTYNKWGDTKASFEDYEKSLKIRKVLARKNPNSVEIALGLSASFERIGLVYEDSGDYKKSIEFYKSSLEISEKLYKLDPKSAEYARAVAAANQKIGDIYITLSDTQLALEYYKKSFRLSENLSKLNPDSSLYAQNLSRSFFKLADVSRMQGDNETSLKNYEHSLRITKGLLELNPDSEQYASDLSATYYQIGYIYEVMGIPENAIQNYEDSNKIRESLIKEYPYFSKYAKRLLGTYYRIAEIYRNLDEVEKSIVYIEKCTMVEELLKHDSSSTEYTKKLSSLFEIIDNN